MHRAGHSWFWCSLGIERRVLAEAMTYRSAPAPHSSLKCWAFWSNECCPARWSHWCPDIKSLGGGAVGFYCGMWQEEKGWFCFPSLSSRCLARCLWVFVLQQTTLWGCTECSLFPFSSPLASSVCVLWGQGLWLHLGSHWTSCCRNKRHCAATRPFSGSAAYRSRLLWCTGLFSLDWFLLTKAQSSVLGKTKLSWSRMSPSMHGCLAVGREAGQPASCTWHWKLLGCDAEHDWARIWQQGRDRV